MTTQNDKSILPDRIKWGGRPRLKGMGISARKTRRRRYLNKLKEKFSECPILAKCQPINGKLPKCVDIEKAYRECSIFMEEIRLAADGSE